MLMAHARRAMVLLLLIGLAPGLAWGVSIGQRDTFQDGSTNGWSVSLLDMFNPSPPVNIPTGGPGGAGDGFLQIAAVGIASSGNQLSAINVRQWTGDYIAAGVTTIRMDLRNFGPDDLSLRLLLSDTIGGQAPNAVFSTVALFLPAGGDWVTGLFPFTPSDLTSGGGSVTAALEYVVELQLYHSVSATLSGASTTATLGVDNITATPAPTSVVLLGSGLLALHSLKTWRGRKLRA